MKFHVAGLLKEPVGSTRRHEVAEEVDRIDDRIAVDGKIEGSVKLMRTNAGVLVDAKLRLAAKQECGRCLGEVVVPLDLKFSEQFLPVVDMATGLPLPEPDDSSGFFISDDHVVDITEAVRQYVLVGLPIAPLCRPDCAGLCPQCGQNRNDAKCDCAAVVSDERWSALEGLVGNEEISAFPGGSRQRRAAKNKKRLQNAGRPVQRNGKKKG